MPPAAAALVAVVLVHNVAVTVVVLLPAGMAWITVLASVNAALQLFLPVDAAHVLVPPDDDANGAEATDDLIGERTIAARIGQKDARHFCSFGD